MKVGFLFVYMDLPNLIHSHYMPNPNAVSWSTEEDLLLKSLCSSGKHRFVDMPALLGKKNKFQVIRRARFLKIVNKQHRPRKYTYNVKYFDTPTLESCYWAGILQTDGCLARRRNYVTIIWGCSSKDRPHMELFRSHIGSTHPIKEQVKKCQLSIKNSEKEHSHCRIAFEGAFEWANALKAHFGFDHNKTLRTSPPALPSLQYKLAYLKGFIDGDGCITYSNQSGAISIGFCGVNRELLIWIKDFVDGLNLPKGRPFTRLVQQKRGEACYYWAVSGLQAAVLHELLIRVPTPQLARKWESPKALVAKQYWKDRADLWPSDAFFTNILAPL